MRNRNLWGWMKWSLRQLNNAQQQISGAEDTLADANQPGAELSGVLRCHHVVRGRLQGPARHQRDAADRGWGEASARRERRENLWCLHCSGVQNSVGGRNKLLHQGPCWQWWVHAPAGVQKPSSWGQAIESSWIPEQQDQAWWTDLFLVNLSHALSWQFLIYIYSVGCKMLIPVPTKKTFFFKLNAGKKIHVFLTPFPYCAISKWFT